MHSVDEALHWHDVSYRTQSVSRLQADVNLFHDLWGMKHRLLALWMFLALRAFGGFAYYK